MFNEKTGRKSTIDAARICKEASGNMTGKRVEYWSREVVIDGGPTFCMSNGMNVEMTMYFY